MSSQASPYTMEDCDLIIQGYWEEWKENQRITIYEFVDYWLEERWRLMNDAMESSEG